MNKLVFVFVVFAAGAAGCSKKGSDCDAALAKTVERLTANAKQRAPNPLILERMMSVMEKLKPTLIERCKADSWSPEVVACYAAANDRKEMAACQAKMTPDQISKLTADMTKVMMAAGPGAGMGQRMPPGEGHPSTLQGSGSGAPGEAPGAPVAGSPEPAAPAGSPAAAPSAPPAAAAGSSGSAGSAAGGGW